MNIPAKYRTALYWVTAAVMALATLGTAVGIIPAGAIERGVDAGTQMLTLVAALVAVTHVNPGT